MQLGLGIGLTTGGSGASVVAINTLTTSSGFTITNSAGQPLTSV